jgi:hypothetical protein
VLLADDGHAVLMDFGSMAPARIRVTSRAHAVALMVCASCISMHAHRVPLCMCVCCISMHVCMLYLRACVCVCATLTATCIRWDVGGGGAAVHDAIPRA